jgi:OFA family oxalate/formate antiporter-like MFS transporter
MSILITRYGITEMFVTLGIVYVVMMWVASILLRKPSWWKEEENLVSRASYVLRDKEFILIWIMFYLNVHNGLMIISYEKQILSTSLAGASILPLAVLIVPSISALFNAAGRVGYSTLSDRYAADDITRAVVYAIIFAISSALSIIVTTTLKQLDGACSLVLIAPYLFAINAGYGGGFSTLPALLSERFGMKNISQIHGLALSAWGVAGITGNNLTEVILRSTNSYSVVVYVTVVLYIVAFYCCYLLCNHNKKEEPSRVYFG